ncbi:hypothetical protein GQ43DRAFT_253791 [Delitschia confertaspora ATCC 74209]|uniref:Uncharacterized protein n=1 Tax=Delitschia confertaspora ATCC 74209 TaxID=1513339 RepID=A0A9P4N1A2_9PLEO|nr:hypothetical protein GQ43DRAFT_253791 [Delitschia confertaspora ATCC 74209]
MLYLMKHGIQICPLYPFSRGVTEMRLAVKRGGSVWPRIATCRFRAPECGTVQLTTVSDYSLRVTADPMNFNKSEVQRYSPRFGLPCALGGLSNVTQVHASLRPMERSQCFWPVKKTANGSQLFSIPSISCNCISHIHIPTVFSKTPHRAMLRPVW